MYYFLLNTKIIITYGGVWLGNTNINIDFLHFILLLNRLKVTLGICGVSNGNVMSVGHVIISDFLSHVICGESVTRQAVIK